MKKYSLFVAVLSVSTVLLAQKPAKDWHYSAPSKKNMGISVYEAYQSAAAQVKPQPIVVAVIDGGTDINHEDLKDVLWTNTKEVAGNGIDDDGNGYIDDVHGWNFIGGKDGRNVGADNLEKVRVYKKLRDQYQSISFDSMDYDSFTYANPNYLVYEGIKSEIESTREGSLQGMQQLEKVLEMLNKLRKESGKDNPTAADLKEMKSDDPFMNGLAQGIAKAMEKDKTNSSFEAIYNEIQEGYKAMDIRANYQYNPDYDSREIVGDNYANSSERYYGNSDVVGPDASHGSHVAGIIAATRGNNIGLDGISDAARIMVVRVVPDGDERDKDVANGIRYAVDNGAKIINMSFGKGFSWDKAAVDSAVAYAGRKGVLLVHAAGNSGMNIDMEPNYPNDSLWGGQVFAENWIEIGASQPALKALATDFSNYGKNNVDLFSPGRDIYSTIPNNKYEYFNGTSMAAPVTAGVAAFVWSRYPNLTAVQMKTILMESGTLVKGKVILPGTKKTKIKFSEICKSSRLVNAKNAIEMAASMSK